MEDDDGVYLAATWETDESERDTDGGIVQCNRIPVHFTMSAEEIAANEARKRAGKSYATVKLSNPDRRHRCKRGQIVDRDTKKHRSCLEIETVNTCASDGMCTFIGVVYPYGYEKIWFMDDELEKFETFDKEGKLIHGGLA